ncbi:mCG1027863 [Mus musculus]|jgi:hypothetical protein|nr:mCG1027863 [Mus musculus]
MRAIITLQRTAEPGFRGLPPHRLLGLSQSSKGEERQGQDVQERTVGGGGGVGDTTRTTRGSRRGDWTLPTLNSSILLHSTKFLNLGHLRKEEKGCPDGGRSLPLNK